MSRVRAHHMVAQYRGTRPRESVLYSLAMLTLIGVALAVSQAAHAQTTRVREIIDRAMELKPDVSDGAQLYRAHCSSCHGSTGHGDARAVVPSIAGQVSSYLIKQLADLAEGDREIPEMHRTVSRAEFTTPQALRNVTGYIHNLPANTSPQRGDGKQLTLGEKVYGATCRQCHGEKGDGNEANYVPALRGLDYAYLLSQMRRLAVGHRYSVDIDVIELLEALKLDDLSAVADHITRLPVPPGHAVVQVSVPTSNIVQRSGHEQNR